MPKKIIIELSRLEAHEIKEAIDKHSIAHYSAICEHHVSDWEREKLKFLKKLSGRLGAFLNSL